MARRRSSFSRGGAQGKSVASRRRGRVASVQSSYDAIVVGSGFGGGIDATSLEPWYLRSEDALQSRATPAERGAEALLAA